jgi:transposase
LQQRSYVRVDQPEIDMTYAMEFRVAVAKAYDESGSSLEVAQAFGCSASWVRRLIQRRRASGSLAPRVARRGDTAKLDGSDLEKLHQMIKDQPDLTLGELAAALGYKASVPTIWRATQKLGLVYKKKTLHASEQDRPDVKRQREEWFEKFAGIKVKQLVFIDEFGAVSNMTRTHGRGPRGQRVVCKTPHGHRVTLSTIAAMTVQGMVTGLTFSGATNTEIFEQFVEQCLVAKLERGQIVIMDNLTAHKSPRIVDLIESAGAKVLSLPPYSPDYNPIEMAISKVKALLRKLGARTVDALFDAISQAMLSVTPEDAINYIHQSGYAATIT